MPHIDGLTATGIGHLHGGRWGAVRTGLAMLHAREAVIAGRQGMVERAGPRPPDAEPLEQALFAAIYDDMGPRELAERPRVREAIGDVRRDLVRRGLIRPQRRRVLVPLALTVLPPFVLARLIDVIGPPLGLTASVVLVGAACWFLPRRTVAGERALRQLRALHPDPADPGDTPAKLGTSVALYGAQALLATMPVFARDSGLLDGGRWSVIHSDSQLRSSSAT